MARTEIDFPSITHAQLLFGRQEANLRYLEDLLELELRASGNAVKIAGSSTAVSLAERSLLALYEMAKENREPAPVDFLAHIDGFRRELPSDNSERRNVILMTNDKRFIAPKSANQVVYVEAMRKNDVVFGVGPAGSGKTYLAMAMAIDALSRKTVKRIVLVRPAVEAGERLGFLPGDMAEKVNPYLRPLYDALYDMVDFERAQRWLSQGLIEVAPLAFMRGRTLNAAFIILDEAQNTTPEQMKMFLTRFGHGAKVVVTGDLTQTDLGLGQRSGLVHALEILKDVEGLSIVHLDEKDIVRHKLVQAIVMAYERHAKKASS